MRDYVILLEDLDFGISKDQLDEITELHNNGMDFQDIATAVNRNQYEIILALLHQVKLGKHMLPFARRPRE